MTKWLVACCLLLLGCGGSEPKEPVAEVRDFRNFTLSERIRQQAPYMQQHLQEMVHFNSRARFPIKPEWVWRDMDEQIQSRLDPLAGRMNLVHLARWHGDQHLWSGSLMINVGSGFMAVSRSGLMLKLVKKDQQYHLTLSESDSVVEIDFPLDEVTQRWVDFGEDRFFFYYYTFPEWVVSGSHSSPGPSDEGEAN